MLADLDSRPYSGTDPRGLPDSCRSPDAGSDLEAIAAEKQMLSRDGRMTPELHEAAVRIAGIPNQANLAKAYTNEFLKP